MKFKPEMLTLYAITDRNSLKGRDLAGQVELALQGGVTCVQLHEIASSVRIPIAAIGGITAENVSEIKGCGYRGIAAVSAVFAEEDVKAAAELLRRKAEEGIGL